MSERERIARLLREFRAANVDTRYVAKLDTLNEAIALTDALLAAREGGGVSHGGCIDTAWEQYKRDLATLRQAKDEIILDLRAQLATATARVQALEEAGGKLLAVMRTSAEEEQALWLDADAAERCDAACDELEALLQPEAPRAAGGA